MAKESERMHLMKESFMDLHQQGISIPKIAEKFDLSYSAVYHALQDIADENGVTRASLLTLVRTSTEKAYEMEAEIEKVNFEEIKQCFKEINESISLMVDIIDSITLNEKEDINGYDS